MKNQIKDSGATTATIDLGTISTFGELKNALPSTGTGRVPGIKQLCKKAAVILRKETGSGIIELYDNGFFTFEEFGHTTVYGVDRCEWSSTYTEGDKNTGREMLDFADYPWEMILEAAGSARLGHNADSREEYQEEISIDAPESENNIELSVRPEHEIRDEEEEVREHRQKRGEGVKKEYASLRDDQKQLIEMYFIKKMRQEDIAMVMGIDRTAVTHRIATIKKRLQKFL